MIAGHWKGCAEAVAPVHASLHVRLQQAGTSTAAQVRTATGMGTASAGGLADHMRGSVGLR